MSECPNFAWSLRGSGQDTLDFTKHILADHGDNSAVGQAHLLRHAVAHFARLAGAGLDEPQRSAVYASVVLHYFWIAASQIPLGAFWGEHERVVAVITIMCGMEALQTPLPTIDEIEARWPELAEHCSATREGLESPSDG